MSSVQPDLKMLIDPVGEQTFFSEYWETKPLHVARGAPQHYSPILSGHDIDYIISTACLLRNSSVEMLGEAADGREVSRFPDRAGAVYKAYREGASIRVRGAHRYWKPVWMLCQRLRQLLSFPVRANLYCTPAGSRALHRHYDEHDVFVLQIAGRKHWRVFESPVKLPLQFAPLLHFESADDKDSYRRAPQVKEIVERMGDASPTHELTMEAGDLLYLPRGFVHEAWTEDKLSAHLTVGAHALTWIDLLTVALGQMGHKDIRFRSSLPVGFANETVPGEALKARFDELLAALSRDTDLAAATEELAGSFFGSEQTLGEGSIAGDDNTEEIGGDTILEKKPGLLCRVVSGEGTVGLASPDSVIWMPTFFEQTLSFVAQAAEFKVRLLPGGMSERSKVTLAKRLLQEGFVRVVARR